MNRRIRWKWLATAATLAVGLAFLRRRVAAAAAAAPRHASGGGSTTSGSSSGKTFPDFRIAYDTGIDFLDPGLSYTVQGWEIMWNVYLPLLGYKHVNGPDGATLVPYLAQDMPTVSADGKTYTLTLRDGLKYSDGTPIKASDFAATIERDYKIDSPGVGFFSEHRRRRRVQRDEEGPHQRDHRRTTRRGKITIKLNAPQGDFKYILATEFAAPVPANSPAEGHVDEPVAGDRART